MEYKYKLSAAGNGERFDTLMVRALAAMSKAQLDWTRFTDSWQDLRRDEYRADGGRDRFRRSATATRATS